jgi:Tfp pilus assembly protein PilO
MIWREKRILLIVLGVLLLANTIFFFTYRVQYVNRLQDLDAKQEQTKARLQQAQRARITAEQQLAAYKKVQSDLQVLYTKTWATSTERLTALIDEVKKLAAASHLEPPSYVFTSSETKSPTRGSVGATTVGIAFTVQGTYEEVRRLINLLELSDQFVIIDGIGLAGSGAAAEKTLTLNIRLKTLFRDTRVPAPTANKQM